MMGIYEEMGRMHGWIDTHIVIFSHLDFGHPTAKADL